MGHLASHTPKDNRFELHCVQVRTREFHWNLITNRCTNASIERLNCHYKCRLYSMSDNPKLSNAFMIMRSTLLTQWIGYCGTKGRVTEHLSRGRALKIYNQIKFYWGAFESQNYSRFPIRRSKIPSNLLNFWGDFQTVLLIPLKTLKHRSTSFQRFFIGQPPVNT